MGDSVQLLSLNCNHCGGSLGMQAGTRFVTCTYCGAKLEIHRSGNAAYTEVLENIQQQTGQIAENIETIKLQNQLEQLDREWMMEREQYLTRDKHGNTSEPSPAGSIVAALIAGAFGLFWTITAASAGAGVFSLFGLVFVGVAIFAVISAVTKSDGYSQAHQRYQTQRQRLVDALRQQDGQ